MIEYKLVQLGTMFETECEANRLTKEGWFARQVVATATGVAVLMERYTEEEENGHGK